MCLITITGKNHERRLGVKTNGNKKKRRAFARRKGKTSFLLFACPSIILQRDIKRKVLRWGGLKLITLTCSALVVDSNNDTAAAGEQLGTGSAFKHSEVWYTFLSTCAGLGDHAVFDYWLKWKQEWDATYNWKLLRVLLIESYLLYSPATVLLCWNCSFRFQAWCSLQVVWNNSRRLETWRFFSTSGWS